MKIRVICGYVIFLRYKMWQEISKFGKKLVQYGFVNSHFGNISVRVGNKILITRSGSMLDELNKNSFVEVAVDKPGKSDKIASMETPVHREIYKQTPALAVIHAHCPFAVVLSMVMKKNKIKPDDVESKYFLKEIPIIAGMSGSPELAADSANALKNHRAIIVKDHGVITVGKNIEEAYTHICIVEHSCKLKYYVDLYKKNF